MPSGVDRAAHRSDVGGHSGRSLVVHNAHGLDLVIAVFAQALFDPVGLNAMAPTVGQAGGLIAAGQG
ncbi:hypothetical protein D9M69_610550 [compost metagenome]